MSIVVFNSATVKSSRTFGLGLGRHQSDRLPIGPRNFEAAWYAGLSLALDGIEADAPSGYTAFEAEAFDAGQEQGFRELDQDRMEAYEDFERQSQIYRERNAEQQEIAEMGSQIGHDCTADARDDGPSHGFADELLRAVEENDKIETVQLVDEVGRITEVPVPAFEVVLCPRLRKPVETLHTKARAKRLAKKGQVA